MIIARHAECPAKESLRESRSRFEETDLPELLYRFLWLILDESKGMILIGADDKKLPNALAYARQYGKSLESAALPTERDCDF